MEEFFDISYVGKLMLEHTFYQLGNEPVLFTCIDTKSNRYLCSCYRLDEGWVIGQVLENTLIALIDDDITIREVFEKCCAFKFVVTWNGDRFDNTSNVPDDVLPKVGALLELSHEKSGQYRETLAQKELIKSIKQYTDYTVMSEYTDHIVTPVYYKTIDMVKSADDTNDPFNETAAEVTLGQGEFITHKNSKRLNMDEQNMNEQMVFQENDLVPYAA